MASAREKKRAAASSPLVAAQLTRHQMARIEMRAAICRDAVEALALFPEWTEQSEYTQQLGVVMAAAVADGATLDQLGTLPQCPPRRIMAGWVVDEQHPFHKLYYRGKELCSVLMEERAVVAATTSLVGVRRRRYQSVDREGDIHDLEEEIEFDNVERSRLVVGAYQWALEHLMPKRWGRRPETGQSNEQLEALFQALKAGPVD